MIRPSMIWSDRISSACAFSCRICSSLGSDWFGTRKDVRMKPEGSLVVVSEEILFRDRPLKVPFMQRAKPPVLASASEETDARPALDRTETSHQSIACKIRRGSPL